MDLEEVIGYVEDRLSDVRKEADKHWELGKVYGADIGNIDFMLEEKKKGQMYDGKAEELAWVLGLLRCL